MKQALALVSFMARVNALAGPGGSHNAQPGALAAARELEVGANRKHLLKVAEVSAGIALAVPLVFQFYAVRELLAAVILFTVACTLLGVLGLIVVLTDVAGELLLGKLWSTIGAWIGFCAARCYFGGVMAQAESKRTASPPCRRIATKHLVKQEETTMRIDKELHQRVEDELAWEPSVNAAQVGVSVDSGVVMLSGTVRSYAEKWAAERAAERVKGVQAVTDEIVVRLPGDLHRGDADIARAAVNALEWNASLPQGRIQVLVRDGWITLDGRVDFYFQKAEAERAVRNLLGVKGIVNRVNVRPVISPSDVKNQIAQALERAAKIDAKKISVEALDTKVILRGAVKSLAERDEAEQAAWAAPGVSEVENKIEIAA